jgi:hypothetical protein
LRGQLDIPVQKPYSQAWIRTKSNASPGAGRQAREWAVTDGRPLAGAVGAPVVRRKSLAEDFTHVAGSMRRVGTIAAGTAD